LREVRRGILSAMGMVIALLARLQERGFDEEKTVSDR
jgi:hypothetical protein